MAIFVRGGGPDLMLFGGEEEVVADGGPLLLFWGEASGDEMV